MRMSKWERRGFLAFYTIWVLIGGMVLLFGLISLFSPLVWKLVIISLVGFVITYIGTHYLIKFLTRAGKLGIDYHKPTFPKIPEGGYSIWFGLAGAIWVARDLFPEYFRPLSIFLIVVSLAYMVGAIDDQRPLDALWKPGIFLLLGVVLVYGGGYSGTPILPIIGGTRLHITYIIMIPFIIAIITNTVNQMDMLNGVLPGSTIIILIGVIIAAFILDKPLAIVLAVPLLAVLLGYYPFNRYPAKLFSGDVGSLTIGAALGTIAVLGGLEVIVLIALIPHLFNSFLNFASLRGFKDRRSVPRPTQFHQEDGRLGNTPNRLAGISLLRFLVARTPLTEKELIPRLYLLVLVSTVLAILTALVIPQ